MIVVDASLATKWFVIEPDSAAALRFLQTHKGDLHGPDLLLVEVPSAIVRRANEDKAFAPQARAALSDWRAAWENLHRHELTAELVEGAAALAMRLGHPLADCVYLALAMAYDCDLATCDAKFQAKASRHYGRVRLLQQYENQSRTVRPSFSAER